ncbi:MAG: TAT-variant-translocated molybdopterin oxidoreductase [Ignavibacteria bacterium]|nr:TAT-variant-translocated molybdopterin oxidoreductase [Ignavibacteria bacterium]
MEDKRYWKFFDELQDTAKSEKLKQEEFPEGLKSDKGFEQTQGINRRKFLALTASTAAIFATACSDYRDKGSIVPYNQQPENIQIGKPNFYASTCTSCLNHCGILIKTREGRPLKIDGNPDHPINKGKICPIGQASILNLYHPERLRKPLKKNGKSFNELNWNTLFTEILASLEKASNNGKIVAILSQPIFSPTFVKLIYMFQAKYPTTKVYTYSYLESYSKEQAWEEFYPKAKLSEFDFSRANVILAIESNFLANEGNFVRNIQDFVSKRDINRPNEFSRFYSVETDLSLTGANADYRIPLKADFHYEFLATLLNELLKRDLNYNRAIVEKIQGKFSRFNLEDFASKAGVDIKLVRNLIDDLIQNKGKTAVIAGDSHFYEVHLLCLLINEVLGNSSIYRICPQPSLPKSKLFEIEELVTLMNQGKVGVLFNLDTNPVFHFPSDLGFENALSKVESVVSFVEFESETANRSHYIVPISHNFESWGDYYDGIGLFSTIQPVIEPLFGTYQKEDFLLSLVQNKLERGIYHKYLKSNWQESYFSQEKYAVDFEKFWHSVLHDGTFELKQTLINDYTPNFELFDKIEHRFGTKDWVLVIKKPYFIGDGKFLNNGWLNELPHPITKVTWDNYAGISQSDANRLGLKNGDIVELGYGKSKLEIPIFVVPGIPSSSVVIEAGFGRKESGIVAENVGFYVGKILQFETTKKGYIFEKISLNKINKSYQIATTVEHHSLNDTFYSELHKKRHIIQEGLLEDYKNGKYHIHRPHELKSIVPEIKYTDVKWAMVIDMNKCVGCGACIMACNVENNIPVVGKDQVLRSREMQWIRVDTYFSGTAENPEVSFQTMLCQHCDDAPCENVCPVVATVHSSDGLNLMVYNRCVGTRYCSNNCPYKVRRFNFFDFRSHFKNGLLYKDTYKLANNPEVTVRSRGVMEKCTFCIQRITEARHQAIAENKPLRGNGVRTACQEACPANAITFGDMNDKESELYQLRNHKLGYYVLEELNVKPNVTYIAKLRNKKSEVGA